MENTHSKNENKPHAIIVAHPLQGHLIPTVHLAMKLASKGLSITFINAENIHHLITQSNTIDSGSAADIFAGAHLDIEYMTVSDGLPVEYDRSLNHDQWVVAIMHCYPAHVEVAVAKIVKSRPLVRCLITDTYSVWASKVAKKFGLAHVSFWTEAATVLDIYFHLHLLKENGHVGPGARKDIIEYIPGIRSIKPTDLMSYLQEEDLTTILHQCIFGSMDDAKQADFVLGNNIQELEAEPISAIQTQVPFYAIGPLFPPDFTNKGPIATSLWAETNCSHWLDTKPLGSVLFVSFGSYAHISKDQLANIAEGIKLSGVNFLWVLRPDMVSSDDPDPLPLGFKDEVHDRGMVVTWTCQITVLSHRAIGGFLTHCGWNSILEGIWCEVPLLCFPLLTDQFTNRRLVVDDWKIGYNLCDEKEVSVEEVCQKIKILLCHDSMRHKLTDKIKKVKQILENTTSVEGSSNKNIDTFIKNLNVSL